MAYKLHDKRLQSALHSLVNEFKEEFFSKYSLQDFSGYPTTHLKVCFIVGELYEYLENKIGVTKQTPEDIRRALEIVLKMRKELEERKRVFAHTNSPCVSTISKKTVRRLATSSKTISIPTVVGPGAK
jgi:hypothetical protein